MKRILLLTLAAALLLFAVACSAKPGADTGDTLVSGEAQLPAPSQDDDMLGDMLGNSDEAASSEESSEAAVPASEYDAYLKKYLVPYGSLKFYDKDWTSAADLGADRIFEFALQKNFNFYNSAMDYAQVFGDEFTYLQVPEKWFDENAGLVYPQDIIENTAIEYFGLDAAFLRAAKSYLPAKNGYTAPPQSADPALASTAELLPEVVQVTRNGKRAEITFTLTPCDPLGNITEGAVQKRVMVVEDKEESFRYVSVTAA